MTKQAMAQLVAHLEVHGYVERVPDPGDGAPSSCARGARARGLRDRPRVRRRVRGARDRRAGGGEGAALRALLEELEPRSDENVCRTTASLRSRTSAAGHERDREDTASASQIAR